MFMHVIFVLTFFCFVCFFCLFLVKNFFVFFLEFNNCVCKFDKNKNENLFKKNKHFSVTNAKSGKTILNDVRKMLNTKTLVKKSSQKKDQNYNKTK